MALMGSTSTPGFLVSSGQSKSGNLISSGQSIGAWKKGLSAYDIAVAEGFEGSQAEWVESLKAERVELMLDDDDILWWRYVNESEWQMLRNLGEDINRKIKEISPDMSIKLLDDFPENPMENILYVIRTERG